jgi:hypothetical protein
MEMSDYQLPATFPSPAGPAAAAEEETAQEEEEARFITRKQADLFIARQSRLLQYAESAALSPRDLQEQLLVILRSNPGLQAVLRIRIRIHRIHMFWASWIRHPDPLARSMDPDSDPALDPDPSIIKQI